MPETLSTPLSKTDLEAELASVNQRIEKADEYEQIEREAKRDTLVFERDWIIAALRKLSDAENEVR